MIFTQSDSTESKTTEALVPMVDLFAVLAIVFMIYSSDEITASQQLSQEKIDQVVSDYKQLQDEIDANEKARQERRKFLANNAEKSLEEIEAEREKKSEELIKQFTEMLAAQQNQAALEYENLVARVEFEHEEEVEKEKVELEAEKQLALEMEVFQLNT